MSLSLDKFPEIRAELKSTFASGRTKSVAWRQQQLLQLARLVQYNADALAEAIHKDLGKPRFEVFLTEINIIAQRSITCAKEVGEWEKDEDNSSSNQDWQVGWAQKIRKEPKGVALIIAPWNYPLTLSLQPLYGAIAAGCCAVIKPSEVAPSFSSTLAELVPKYLDNSAFRVIEGAVPEITRLLELQWDHIFYTGNRNIARIISTAAARHLTPLTLELGGKSPVIIDPETDIDLAAKRILYGKSQNAGQLCVSPDYILCPTSVLSTFINSLMKYAAQFWPEGSLKSSSFGRIVSNTHFNRLSSLLEHTNSKVVYGGGKDFEGTIDPQGRPRGMEMTLLTLDKEYWEDDALLAEELFGPLLPILPVVDLNEAIQFVNARDHPLVVYAFCKNEETKAKILENTTSGVIVFNDTFQQLSRMSVPTPHVTYLMWFIVDSTPLGGVGGSGYGRQVLRYSFDEFSYRRAIVAIPNEAEKVLDMARYPPYTQEKFDILCKPVHVPRLEDL